ncbi:MAG: GIY-YIG nuclease family protein [Patescibacteria group bacterium]
MFIYILRSLKTNAEYVGMSSDPERRLKEHNAGEIKSTKAKRPWAKVWEEECENRVEARKREKYLKSAAGRRFRKSLRTISSAG